MKTLILIALNLICITCHCQDYSKYDRISKKTDLTINGIKATGISIEEAIAAYGEPDRIEDFFFEIDNEQGFFYWYNDGLRLSLQNTYGLKLFNISSSKYAVTKHKILIGNDIDTIKEIFPISYSTGIDVGAFYILFSDADYYLAIVFDKGTNRITEINLYEF